MGQLPTQLRFEHPVLPCAAVDVGGGTLEVYIAYRGFHVFTSKGDLCEAVACPIVAGPQSFTFRQSLPKIAPPVCRRQPTCP
jgi:hypothetical protein